MRGCIEVLAHASGEDTFVSSKVQLIDSVSRKQTHVCRAAFEVELLISVDTADVMMMFNGALYELQHGVQTTE
eukprot:2587498-Lingulodinium_polyedra.AAC.1